MKRILILIFISTFLFSCENKEDRKVTSKKDTSSLPASNGAIGEVLLVVDTAHLNLDLGKSLENVFLEPFPGLPQPELPFQLTRINYKAFKSLFKRHKTVLFAVPFDDGESSGYMNDILGDDVVEKIKSSGKNVHFMNDVFAKNQQMVFVFGNTQKDIAENIEKYKTVIFSKIDEEEERRVEKNLFNPGLNKKISNQLEKDYGYSLKIPKDYKLVKSSEKFTWLRLALEEYDYNIVISKMPYSSEIQFDSAYIAEWRTNLGVNVNAGDTSSSKIVQDIFPFDTKLYTEPIYKVEDRGLWKLKNNIMGGPFVSYTFASSDRKSIYYIEGFVAAPGKDKRELVRELEVVLKTFKG